VQASTSRSAIVRYGVFEDVSVSSLPTFFTFMGRPVSVAQANYTSSASFNESGLEPTLPSCFCASSASNVSLNPTGIVAGVGAEWKIWSNFVVGAEYLHYAFNSSTAIPAAGGTAFVGISLPTATIVGPSSGDHVSLNSVDVIRVRASYLFNWWNR
jgi:opacity protein-like surface antigen